MSGALNIARSDIDASNSGSWLTGAVPIHPFDVTRGMGGWDAEGCDAVEDGDADLEFDGLAVEAAASTSGVTTDIGADFSVEMRRSVWDLTKMLPMSRLRPRRHSLLTMPVPEGHPRRCLVDISHRSS